MTSDSNLKINKKSWSSEEDVKLVNLIDELGVTGSWTMISSRMGDRSGKQCRERYHNHLKPEINKSAFTKEEDALVNELQRKLGNQWAKISKYFNGRSDNAVKNRWHIINRSKNVAEIAAHKPIKKPAVPKLALHLVVPTVPKGTMAHSTSAPVDLLNLYYCHSEHNHEPTSSSRSRTSSGRQSGRDVVGLIKSQMKPSVYHSDGHSSSESCYDNEDEGGDDSESDCDTWLDELLSDSHYTSSDPTSASESEDCDLEEISQDEINYIMSSNIFEDDERNISPRVDTAHVEVVPSTAVDGGKATAVLDTFSDAALTQREEPEEYEYTEEGCELLLPLSEEGCENGGPISINTSPQVLATAHSNSVRKPGSTNRLVPRRNRLFSSTTPIPTPTKSSSGSGTHTTHSSKSASPAAAHVLKRQRGRPLGGSPQIKQE